MAYNTLYDNLKRLSINASGPQLRIIVSVAVVVPIVLFNVVVRPHNIEIHLLIAWSLQESVVERTLQKWLAIEPIPIVNKGVYAIFKSCVNPFFYNNRVVVMLIAPVWQTWLVVSFKARISLLDNLPFALTIGP